MLGSKKPEDLSADRGGLSPGQDGKRHRHWLADLFPPRIEREPSSKETAAAAPDTHSILANRIQALADRHEAVGAQQNQSLPVEQVSADLRAQSPESDALGDNSAPPRPNDRLDASALQNVAATSAIPVALSSFEEKQAVEPVKKAAETPASQAAGLARSDSLQTSVSLTGAGVSDGSQSSGAANSDKAAKLSSVAAHGVRPAGPSPEPPGTKGALASVPLARAEPVVSSSPEIDASNFTELPSKASPPTIVDAKDVAPAADTGLNEFPTAIVQELAAQRSSREGSRADVAAKEPLKPLTPSGRQSMNPLHVEKTEEPMSRVDEINRVLKKLSNESLGLEASALISEDGLMIASALSASMEETRVAGMTATLLSLGSRASMELKRGAVQEVIVRGDHGYVVLISAGRGTLLLALTNESSKLGLIFFDMREAVVDLQKAL
jgi:predicted regulator of Ras-like GTPase activity (Roadblock/LC7/MglB family)